MLILKKLGGLILSIIKSKWFWFILLVILLLFYINKNRNKNLEIERLNNNSIVLDQSIKKLTTKNGELYYSVNALTLKKDEFSDSNSVLNKQLKEMGIKLKNVQSINQMSISYIKNYDSIDSKPMVITDTVFINKLDNNGNINFNSLIKSVKQLGLFFVSNPALIFTPLSKQERVRLSPEKLPSFINKVVRHVSGWLLYPFI